MLAPKFDVTERNTRPRTAMKAPIQIGRFGIFREFDREIKARRAVVCQLCAYPSALANAVIISQHLGGAYQ
jgi:hypothetical protein